MAPVVKVVGLDHLVLRCADVEQSLAFYCDTLGLTPERADAWRRGEVPFPSVRVTPTTIIDLLPAEPSGVNVDHFCLVVEPVDLVALAQQFPDAHLAHGLFGAQGVASSLYVRDPDGHTVELRSYESGGS
jgi:catechol 2,3-dioxygenase-like lactoylglutathione lyase family enzyme